MCWPSCAAPWAHASWGTRAHWIPWRPGVLAVFIGKATSAADRQLDHDKTYEATLRLGQRTDTGDITGTVLETAPVTVGGDGAARRAAPFSGRTDAAAAHVQRREDQRPAPL